MAWPHAKRQRESVVNKGLVSVHPYREVPPEGRGLKPLCGLV